ncbi:MAG: rRNA maturation RNase YbeY [Woeseiaceae bacterium]
MTLEGRVTVEVQVASSVNHVPNSADIRKWIEATIAEAVGARSCEVSVRVVDEEESRDLNNRFRGKDHATNVLSFPTDESMACLSAELQGTLGDIVICGPVVESEAGEQGKDIAHHWAHLLIHGTLHLLGHDHMAEADARRMEALEIRILGLRGVADPYITDEH